MQTSILWISHSSECKRQTFLNIYSCEIVIVFNKNASTVYLSTQFNVNFDCVCVFFKNISYVSLHFFILSGLIATACGDDMLRIFRESADSTADQPQFELVVAEHRAHAQDVNTCRWHPTQSGLLLSTSDDGEAKVWQYVDDEN